MSTPSITDDVRHELARRVRNLRTAQRVSQEELAYRMTTAGIPTSSVTVGRIEAGTRPTPVEELFVIAQALNSDVSTILPTLETGLEQTRQFLNSARDILALIENSGMPIPQALRHLTVIAGTLA